MKVKKSITEEMPNIKPGHHRKNGFGNSDNTVVIGHFPWYEMLWRSMRGDFKPMAPPALGYESFARDWSTKVSAAERVT